MNLFLVLAAGVLAGSGALLMIRGVVGPSLPLASIVAELHRPRVAAPKPKLADELLRTLAGKTTPARKRDLAICERDNARLVRDRAVWAMIGAGPGLCLLPLSLVRAISIPPALLVASMVAGLLGGWLYARRDLAKDAEQARREFRHALAAYLELVTILMAGGAGVETAMFDAAAIGRGGPFRHVRAALTSAQARREAPWRSLGLLGDRLGIVELEMLEASMTLAGGGAMVKGSLTAKATAMRVKALAQMESEAQSRTETMVLPTALLFAAFLLLIGFPAFAALSGI